MKQPARQKGIALLMLLIIIVLAIAAYMMSGLSPTEIKVDREVKTLQALKKAKEALIAYAVNYPEGHARGPGFLPCPDTNNDGSEEGGCNGAVDTVGRLPWKRLGVGDIRDSSNERLWYAVSVNYDFTNNPERPSPPYLPNTPKAINTTSIGNITVRDRNNNIIYDGTTIHAAVAVIIAPGGILTRDDGVTQVRGTDAEKKDPVNYLDIDTASGEDNATFQQGSLGGATKDGFIDGEIINAAGDVIVNDQIMVITYSDIMEQVHKRVSREISKAINNYVTVCGNYPNASIFDPTDSKVLGGYTGDAAAVPPDNDTKGHIPVDSANWVGCGNSLPSWVGGEDWHKVTYYEFTDPCTPGADCLTVDGVNDKKALIIFAGRETGTQSRGDVGPPASDLLDYFEVENSNGDLVYDSTEIEDYVHVIAP